MVKHSKRRAASEDQPLDKTTTFRRSAISLAVAAALPGALMLPGQTLAQQDEQEPEYIEEIITTGYRRSLQNSMAMKQTSDSIVEAVSAEDLGKLPDISIAESIARLPGLTAQRLNGRGQVISVRGLSPDFTTALLNGREQISTGDNRGVEFDQYPSELLQSVVIYKTPDAQLIGQGLAGTADMRTIRPLQHGRRTFNAGIRYEWTEQDALNAGTADDGERLTLSYVDQFANDTVGIAVGFSHMSNPSQEERFNAWGYPTGFVDCATGEIVGGNGCSDGVGTNEEAGLIIGGAKPFVRSGELDRQGVIGILEYAPTDTFTAALDVYYSEFEENQWLRGIELPLLWGGVSGDPTFTESDGLVTAGTFDGVKGVVRNDLNKREADLIAIGLNFEFALSDTWWAEVDFSHNSVDRTDNLVESYAGTGPAGVGATDTLGFEMIGEAGARFDSTLDYADPNLIVLTGPQGWGDGFVPGTNGGQLGYLNSPTIDDELNAIRMSVNRDLDGAISRMEFGLNYQTREKEKVADEFVPYLANGALTATIPNVIGTTDLSFLGIPGMVSYDPLALYRSDLYELYPNPNGDVAIKSWSVEEDVSIVYAQFGVDTEWGNIPVTGNFGAQVVYTDQSSVAVAVDSSGSGFVGVPNTGGKDYWEVLPSFNLTFDFGNERYLRFAAARTLARPRMDDMRASGTWSFDANLAGSPDINNSPWSGDLGNPELDPWIANAFDLSFEKYFADGTGYFSAAVFYKDLESYIFTETVVQDFTGFPTGGIEPVLREGLVTAPNNGQGGRISGVELALQVEGDLLTDALTGFGTVLNASFTDSEIEPNPGNPAEPIPGLSEEVVNATLYYENEVFGARVSARYRSDYRGEVSGFGAGREFRDVEDETVVDAQLTYFFSGRLQGLSAYLQGYNLTDEPFITYANDDTRQVIDYQLYGRSYMIGINYTTN